MNSNTFTIQENIFFENYAEFGNIYLYKDNSINLA